MCSVCGDGEWKKVLLPTEAGGVCLDGSPGGFYYRRGVGSKWLVFHQGGGWCNSHEDCIARGRTGLGSSQYWAESPTGWFYGGAVLFDSPHFSGFHVVYAMYCDGGSWAGNGQYNLSGNMVYYRGRPLMDAFIDVLLTIGLWNATEVVYGGCSAGALAVYINIDYVHRRILANNPSVQVVGIADSMYTFDYAMSPFSERMWWGYQAWNVSNSVNQLCRMQFSNSSEWYCMFAENLIPFIRTSLFIIESENDCWQRTAYVGKNCERCLSQLGRVKFEKLTIVPWRHGVFLTRCGGHCATAVGQYNNEKVNGSTLSQALLSWYQKAIRRDVDFNSLSLDESFMAPRYMVSSGELACETDVCAPTSRQIYIMIGTVGGLLLVVSVCAVQWGIQTMQRVARKPGWIAVDTTIPCEQIDMTTQL